MSVLPVELVLAAFGRAFRSSLCLQSPVIFKNFVMPPKGRKKAAPKAKVEEDRDEVQKEPEQKKAKKTNDAEEKVDGGKPKAKGRKAKAKDENGAASTPAAASNISLSDTDFSSISKTSDGRAWNLKIASWNINGIRAWVDKDGQDYIKEESPDIFCVQETKCSKEKIPDKCKIEGYHAHWSCGDQEGYAGTGMYTKKKPLNVTYGIGVEKHDNEGRVITAEMEKFFIVTAYIPNSGRGLPRLDYRTKEWDKDFTAYLKKLDAKKPVILCGDLNVAHLDIDLKNPKNNKKTAGFTPEEREGFTNLLNEGFVDSFRHLYPEKEGAYTFWAYFMNNRAKDIGWRLDYFVISDRLTKDLCDNVIRKKVMGSDHCPVVLFMAM